MLPVPSLADSLKSGKFLKVHTCSKVAGGTGFQLSGAKVAFPCKRRRKEMLDASGCSGPGGGPKTAVDGLLDRLLVKGKPTASFSPEEDRETGFRPLHHREASA